MQVFFKRAIAEAGSAISPRNENALEVGLAHGGTIID
jgi:hypothetical protein